MTTTYTGPFAAVLAAAEQHEAEVAAAAQAAKAAEVAAAKADAEHKRKMLEFGHNFLAAVAAKVASPK